MPQVIAENPVQLIDIFESFSNTMITVWNGATQKRQTIELDGKHSLELGSVFQLNTDAKGKAPMLTPLRPDNRTSFPLPQKHITDAKAIEAEMVIRIF